MNFRGVGLVFVALAIISSAVAFTSILPQEAMAVSYPYNATTVNVSVLPIASLVITPINLTWPILVPGNTNLTYNLVIKNTGTTQLSSFYMTPSTLWDEATNPINQNNPGLFASAGFIFVRNASNVTGGGSGISGAAPKAFHVGRIEWNITNIMVD